MTRICDIAQLGATVLRQSAASVTMIDSPAIRQTIGDMQATLASTQGVGLAAPQISRLERVIIVASKPSPRYQNAPLMNATVMVNPEYEALSNEKAKDWEGCLSIPGIRALVPRYTLIRVHYQDESGKPVEQVFDDFIARVFQHETDHLDGKVYLDRVESTLDIISENEYCKLFNQPAVMR